MNRIKLTKPSADYRFNAPDDVASYIRNEIWSSDSFDNYREHSYVICTRSNGVVMGHYLLAVGGIDCCIFDKRLTIASALFNHATSIVISHNHPSGDSKPSPNDIAVTEMIRDCCKVFDIKLTDHVIFAEKEFYSFSNEYVTKTNMS